MALYLSNMFSKLFRAFVALINIILHITQLNCITGMFVVYCVLCTV